MIRLISFDLWNTIIEDDEELEKKRGGIRIKNLSYYLSPLNISLDEIRDAYNRLSKWLLETQDRTKRAINTEKQINYILKTFGVRTNRLIFEKIKKSYEEAIFLYPPPIINGVKETLKKFYNLKIDMCIISDAGRTPGWALRKILKEYGIDKYFKKMYFSDETGWVKPNKKAFLISMKEFNVKKDEMVHIGDSLRKDIEGAREAGINFILFSRENGCKVNPCAKNFYEIYNVFLNYFPVSKALFD